MSEPALRPCQAAAAPSHSLFALHELKAVSKWIRHVDTPVAWQQAIIDHFHTGRTKTPHQGSEIPNQERRVRLEGRAKLRIDSKVNPDIITLEPDAASFRQWTGLLNLGNLQEPGVELASAGLPAARHRKLDVVDSHDLHRSPALWAA